MNSVPKAVVRREQPAVHDEAKRQRHTAMTTAGAANFAFMFSSASGIRTSPRSRGHRGPPRRTSSVPLPIFCPDVPAGKSGWLHCPPPQCSGAGARSGHGGGQRLNDAPYRPVRPLCVLLITSGRRSAYELAFEREVGHARRLVRHDQQVAVQVAAVGKLPRRDLDIARGVV